MRPNGFPVFAAGSLLTMEPWSEGDPDISTTRQRGTMSKAMTAEDLLRHWGWMRALARSLVRDDSLAEDAVQDAFLAAVRSPPRREEALGAWLRTALRRCVSRIRVQDEARKRREALAAREERLAREPGHDIETLEVQRILIDEVLRLEEPFRSTVLLRFFDGLTVAAIARRHGVDESTARWRLGTALERLRSALTRRKVGAASWQASLAPLLGRLPAPIEEGAEAAAPGSSAASRVSRTSAYLTTGVAALKLKSIVIAGVLSLIIAGIIIHRSGALLTGSRRTEEKGGARAVPGVVLEEAPPTVAPPPAAEAPAATREEAAAEKVAARVLRGLVTSAITDGPLPGAAVLVRGSKVDTVAGETGEYALEGLPPGELFIVARAEGHAEQHARLRLEDASGFRQDFRLEPAVELRVSVSDPSGRPIEGVEVTPAQPNRDYVHDEVYTRRTGPDGTTLLAGINRNDPPQVNARKAGYSEVWTRDYRIEEEAPSAELRIVLEPRPLLEKIVTGTVTDPGGKPLEGIHVQWIHPHGEREGRQVTDTDRGGRYVLRFETDKDRAAISAYGDGWAPAIREGVKPGDHAEPTVVDFVLEPGHWLEGTVVDEEGGPVEGAAVNVMPSLGTLRNVTLHPGNLRSASTDAEGRFRIVDLAGPRVAIQLRGPAGGGWSHNMNETVDVDRTVDLVLERWKVIRGRVKDADTGEPVPAFTVKLKKGVGYYDYKRCDPGESFHSAEGKFLLEKLDPDLFTFSVEASGYIGVIREDVPSTPLDGGNEIVVEMTRGADLEGVVIDRADGSPIEGAAVSYGVPKRSDLAWDRGALEGMMNAQRSVTGPDGTFRVIESDAGTVFVQAKGYARRAIRPEERKASLDASGERLVVALDRGAVLRGILYQEGAPCRTGFFVLSREPDPEAGGAGSVREWIGNLDRDENGAFEAADLAPGDYILAHYRETPAKATAGLGIHGKVEVPAGGETRVEFGKDYGSLVYAGRLIDTGGQGLDEVHLELEPAFEWRYTRFSAYVKGSHGSRFWFEGLRPGTYRARVRSHDGALRELPDLDLRASAEEETVVVRGR